MKKSFTIFIILMCLASCVSIRTNDLQPVKQFPTQKINKKISINIDSQCYVRGGYTKSCPDYKEDLIKIMDKSDLFGIVGVNEYYADYNVDIKYIRDDNYSLFMTIITFVPSLGLVPKFESDKFFVTIDVTDKKSKKHKRTIFSEKLLNINEILLIPFMPTHNPAQEYINLKKDFLNNITLGIYRTIRELE